MDLLWLQGSGPGCEVRTTWSDNWELSLWRKEEGGMGMLDGMEGEGRSSSMLREWRLGCRTCEPCMPVASCVTGTVQWRSRQGIQLCVIYFIFGNISENSLLGSNFKKHLEHLNAIPWTYYKYQLNKELADAQNLSKIRDKEMLDIFSSALKNLLLQPPHICPVCQLPFSNSF